MFAKPALEAKLLFAYFCVAIVPFAAMAAIALPKTDSARHDHPSAQMTSMSDVTKDRALTCSEDRMIVTTIPEFSYAFESFQSQNGISSGDIARLQDQLAINFTSDFSAPDRKTTMGTPPVEKIVKSLDKSTLSLQYH